MTPHHAPPPPPPSYDEDAAAQQAAATRGYAAYVFAPYGYGQVSDRRFTCETNRLLNVDRF
jgi:hypothetical protein